MKKYIFIALVMLFLLTGCGNKEDMMDMMKAKNKALEISKIGTFVVSNIVQEKVVTYGLLFVDIDRNCSMGLTDIESTRSWSVSFSGDTCTDFNFGDKVVVTFARPQFGKTGRETADWLTMQKLQSSVPLLVIPSQ